MEQQAREKTTEKETYLYRIMPLRYFLTMLDSRTLYLPRVSKWDDPYELFLFKQHYVDSSGRKVDMMSQASRIYGQSWSSTRKSDALWRIYSPDRISVQIKTSVKKLNAWIALNVGSGLHLQLSKVDYKPEKELTKWIESVGSTVCSHLVESLSIKRDSFSHEKEYRLIAWLADFDENNSLICKCPDYIEIPFDPLQMIYEVSLDPRLTSEEFELYKNAISLRLGGKCRISQSTLYKFKQHTIQLNSISQ